MDNSLGKNNTSDKIFQRIVSKNKSITEIIACYLIAIALIVGFIIRFCSLFRYTTFDIGPVPDQVRDAFVYMKMWQGQMPILGPSASVGGYSLPPLYYYLVFPFTILGANPIWQAFPNTLFSFLTIPLLIYLVYELLENINYSLRLLLAGLAGFWYSFIFSEIFISTFQWNPSPIPFFLISFTLIYKHQLESDFYRQAREIFYWLIYGILLAILVSLHSTAMFVMPIVFGVSLIFFVYKHRRNIYKCSLSGLSLLSAIAGLYPYWKGEFSRGFANSKQIILTLINSKNEASRSGILERIYSVFKNYFELGQQAYFVGNSWIYITISILFLSLVLFITIIKFKGNMPILMLLGFTWLLYLYAASNFQGIFFIHYKLLFLISPILFSMISLGYLNYSNVIDKVFASLIILGIVVSISSNVIFDYKYLSSKYSNTRLLATSDIISIFNKIPKSATICEPNHIKSRKNINPYNYIDKYITKRQFEFTFNCNSGEYTLYPKYKMVQQINNLWPVFTIHKNTLDPAQTKLYLDTPVAQIHIHK